jgi:ribonucleoside-diphosphate reductase alpha chain
LTEVVVRENDTLHELETKVCQAAVLGTYQATLTNFKYLRKIWKQNTEEERLLGVSLTGCMDHPVLNGSKGEGILKEWLTKLKERVISCNIEFSEKFGITPATAGTCVKPSGNVSQLVNSSSGMHDRHSGHYIRTARGDKIDPLTQFMIDSGFPVEDDVTKPNNTSVFSFPIKAPKNASLRGQKTAIEQLNLWLIYQEYWCEHKPSITVSVKESEWMQVGSWVYDNFDKVSGISFLPHADHIYKQAPYQEITKEEYVAALKKMPKTIDWNKLSEYEEADNTVSSQELACNGAESCEIM